MHRINPYTIEPKTIFRTNTDTDYAEIWARMPTLAANTSTAKKNVVFKKGIIGTYH